MKISRRHFIKSTGTAGFALWLGLSAKGLPQKHTAGSALQHFSPFIRIEANGKITIYNTKPEMGQGTFQSFPSLIAEELEVTLDQVTILQSNGEKELGTGQRAGGSASIRTSYLAMRKVGAAAREVLILAAANKWNVTPESCYADRAKVIHKPSNKSFTYGALVEDASKLELPKEPKLKDPKNFNILGKSSKRPDVPLKTCGKAEFGIDVRLPEMLYALVVRCPVIGGTLKTFDAKEALKVPGVKKVAAVERIVGKYHYTGVAIIADSYWNALQGRKKLRVQWDTKGYETFNSVEYEAQLRKLGDEEGLTDKNIGSVETAQILPENELEAFYETPMIAHHTLEPMNCVAQIKDNKLEIWTSTQVPSSVTGTGANDLHKYVGFTPENIKLHAKFIGGGFGRRLYMDYIIEAVNVARLTDKPVKVIWSREETTQQGPFRPMTFSKMKAGFSTAGKLMTFQHKVISPSYFESFQADYDQSKVDSIMVEGIGEQAYEVPNLKTTYVRAECHVPVAAWRSVTSSTLAFAHECFIDELAYKAGKDPMNFRLELLSKPSDSKKVLLKLKELSSWDTPLPQGTGRGVAIWDFFAGLCGQVVEVSHHKDKSITIDRVIALIDLGEVVNPDNVKNQVEGSIIMGLTAAIKPGITFKNGEVAEHNFYDNPLLRIHESPKIEVHILADGGKIKGVGEPGLPPFAPALANAIFAATGTRFRKMPFQLKTE
ncbi:xanthine dehydrogenase family protein molybdopterin-binding subunit [Pedobacter gandavensis]|uniref:Molybdopterin-dependent oxidoreductase n=1 Tax=Pedobacter gandavensis TaxID=2679963 RepID=A0ABR6ERZ9_9SPHI|nr:molybdopterin cofactor-binding domain-containing protein [Pedobacter gandavensis]MBB2148035.1 molybdopterin-dependent oxidoreductase [Pedobacter gandavensis]